MGRATLRDSEGLANEEVTVRADGRGAEARRVQEIDAVASMLPMPRCGRLAEPLTEAGGAEHSTVERSGEQRERQRGAGRVTVTRI